VTPQCHLGFLSSANQEPSFYVSKIEHDYQVDLRIKEPTKLILKSIMIKTNGFFKKEKMCNPNKNPN
jgi:hypothetical protein